MRVYTEELEITPAVERTFRVVGMATAEYVRKLAQIVDISQISEGDEEYDYFVQVPLERLHEVDLAVAKLTTAVADRFGVTIDVMPILVPDDPANAPAHDVLPSVSTA